MVAITVLLSGQTRFNLALSIKAMENKCLYCLRNVLDNRPPLKVYIHNYQTKFTSKGHLVYSLFVPISMKSGYILKMLNYFP